MSEKMTAKQIMAFANEALESQYAYDPGRCGRPYYVLGTTCDEICVVKTARTTIDGRWASFDLLEDGRIVGWLDREMFVLPDHAKLMAGAVNRWREIVSMCRR